MNGACSRGEMINTIGINDSGVNKLFVLAAALEL